MGLRYYRAPNGKPNCYESADVRTVDGARDIPYTGSLSAILVPTDSDRDCHLLGVIIDGRMTLIIDCLHAAEEVQAFRSTCRTNAVEVTERDAKIAVPCPPPDNQMQIQSWAEELYVQLTGGDR
jgi:hypothetical protein